MGSPFASLTVSDPIPVPWDAAAWVRVRKLTGREIERCAAVHRGQFADGSPRLWPALLRRALEKGATDPEVLTAIQDPLLGYDRHLLVRLGLVAWSYPHAIARTPPAEADSIDDLVDEALEFMATAVLRRTKPALFLVAEEAAAAQKELSPVVSPA